MWLEDVKSGKLKGLDTLGRIRLYRNDGQPLPDAQAAEICTDHHDDKDNPHEVDDAQVYTGVGGHINFSDYNDRSHDVYITNGRVTSWQIDEVEQLS